VDGWPASGYEQEIDRLTVQYLQGDGWSPGMRSDVSGPAADRWRAIADGVHEAGLGLWRTVTRKRPQTDHGQALDGYAVGQ
jgi:hypothetical protein